MHEQPLGSNPIAVVALYFDIVHRTARARKRYDTIPGVSSLD